MTIASTEIDAAIAAMVRAHEGSDSKGLHQAAARARALLADLAPAPAPADPPLPQPAALLETTAPALPAAPGRRKA